MKTSLALITCLSVSLVAASQAKDNPPRLPSAALSPLMNDALSKISVPLDVKGFTHPESIVSLKEQFADELARAPQTMKPAYQAAMQVCDAVTAAVDERAKAKPNLQASASVHAGTDLGASFKDNPGWNELEKERRERKKLKKEARDKDAFFTAAQQADWAKRAAQLRAGVERLYHQEHEVERQCSAAETAESQKRATALYPELAVADSAFNQDFRRRYDALKASSDPALENPDWPELIAKQSADAISTQSNDPKAAAKSAAPASFADRLATTTWSVDFGGMDPKTAWVTLNPDMTTQSGWRSQTGWWKVIDGSRIEARLTDKKLNKIITFDKDLTHGKDNAKHVYYRLDKPANP